MTPMTALRSWIRSSSCCFIGLAAIKSSDRRDDLVELVLCELWVDRQGQHFVRSALRFRTCTLLVAEVGEAGLQVQRQRVVDRCTDSGAFQVGLEGIALL